MTDIYTIKNLLFFLPYIKKDTWYMLGIGIIVYCIYIIYLIVYERYNKTKETLSPANISSKQSFHDMLDTLSLDDIYFFERLSLIIRTYLEDSEQVLLATKKTHNDIQTESISHEFKEILNICAYYEYSPDEATIDKKTEIIKHLKMRL